MLDKIYERNYSYLLRMLSSDNTGFTHVFEVQPDCEHQSPWYAARFLNVTTDAWDYRLLPCGIGYCSLATKENVTAVTRQVVYFRKSNEAEDILDARIYRPNGLETLLWNARILKSLHITCVHKGRRPNIGSMVNYVNRRTRLNDMAVPQAYMILRANKGRVSGRDILVWDPKALYDDMSIGVLSAGDEKTVWKSLVKHFESVADSPIEMN